MANTKLAINEHGQSPSKILRGVLCQIWDKSEEVIPFEDYYKRSMELIINHYKSKL